MTGSNAAPETDEGWSGILRPGEKILWQGQPEGKSRLRFDAKGLFLLVWGAGFAGIPLLTLIDEIRSPDTSWRSAAFLLLFVCIGVGIVFRYFFWEIWLARNTWYTLSDQRAFVAKKTVRRRTLDSRAVTPNTVVNFSDGDPPSIFFGREGQRHQGRSGRWGFRKIREAREVMDMINRLQKNQA